LEYIYAGALNHSLVLGKNISKIIDFFLNLNIIKTTFWIDKFIIAIRRQEIFHIKAQLHGIYFLKERRKK